MPMEGRYNHERLGQLHAHDHSGHSFHSYNSRKLHGTISNGPYSFFCRKGNEIDRDLLTLLYAYELMRRRGRKMD